MKKIRDAVSLVFECQGEIFVIVRQNFLKAFPGYTAFVGGKVDPEDNEGEGHHIQLLAKHPKNIVNALIRETKEEIGIEIDRMLERGEITAVDFIGRAVSPEFNPYRFNTYFFRISLKEKPHFHIDENEIMSSCWLTPSSLLSQWEQGERLMVPPVRFFIEAMAKELYFQEELIFEKRFDLDKNVPWVEVIKGIVQLMPLSNTVPPAERTNAFLIGDTQKILIDPSPKNKEELNKFLATLEKEKITSLFITHHHKDHHQFSTTLARKLNVPMAMSKDTKERILRVYGEGYFSDIEVKIFKEGDVLVHWNKDEVKVVEVPGHDEGQLALMPKSKKWFLAGDLFQGIGTVVVGGEEGNMTKYMQTLKKVIALAPLAVIPSHGIALGGTYILEKTLEHRIFREQQILEMLQKGLSKEQMLKQIYFDLPEKLAKYALANIQSHVEKLKEEGRI